jgi:hypothetical protein
LLHLNLDRALYNAIFNISYFDSIASKKWWNVQKKSNLICRTKKKKEAQISGDFDFNVVSGALTGNLCE